jgi:rhamnosyltransferase subunit B
MPPRGPMPLLMILLPVGSSGDVLPFVAVGLRLKQRGHRVLVVASGSHRTLVETAGLELIESIDAKADLAAFGHPSIWRPTRGLRRISERIVIPSLRPQIAAIESRFERSNTVIVGSTLAFGARIASEKLGAPMVTIHLAPAAIRSLEDTPVVANIPAFPHLPRPVKRSLYWYFDRYVVGDAIASGLNEVRRDLGMPPVHRPLHEWLHSPTRVIGLFPPWFVAPAPDWPPQVRLTGFALYDGPGPHTLPADVAQFLDEGDPPVAFTTGTAMYHTENFFRAAADACARLGMRGILISSSPGQLPAAALSNVRAFAYAPFSELLPRAKAIVHHGGIGTAAHALRAGLPQVVVPMSFDQPDNAARLERLGVAATLSRRRLDGKSLASALRKLLARPDLSAKLADAARHFEGDTSLDETCRLIEEAGEQGAP